jgi:protein arginine kinase
MELTALKNRPVEWLKGGPEGDVVISSRIRLARNVAGYPFTSTASDEQKVQIEEFVRSALRSPEIDPSLNYVELGDIDALLRDLLLERRLISRQHAEADWPRAVAFDEVEQLSVLINEEDHVRIQFIRGGLRLTEAYREADRFDDLLATRIPFVYSPTYGYLTACPTNVGTGLRASVMLHLPGLSMSQEMEKAITLLDQENLALRGGYGEGAQGAGDFYQISNQATLGVCEDEIVEQVGSAAEELVSMERRARAGLRKNHPDDFRARIERAFRLLASASSISSQETLSLLSQIRMGVEMEVLGQASLQTLNDLFLLTLPAHLQTMEGRVLDSAVRDELRAVYLRDRLSSR